MNIRMIAIATLAAASLSGAAYAQNSGGASGDTSGQAAGKNVTPSTAVQKGDHRSAAGGGAGIEGPAGSKNGPAEKSSKHKSQY